MKKFTFLVLAMLAFCWQGYAQTSDLYLSMIDNGCCDGEKWVSITTGPDGTGTVIFAQGDGTYSNGSGLLTDAMFTVDDGATYYINAYDQYDDSWDGDTYEIRSAPAGGGFLVANNGGASPDDGNDEDVSSTWGDTQEQELEVSEAFSYTPPSCTPGEASATIVPDCGNSQFSIDVDVTLQGNATSIFDGTTSYPVTGTGVVTVGPYADGSSITLEIVHDDVACDFELGTYDYFCPPNNVDCANATPIACGQTINTSSVGSTGTAEDSGCTMGDNGIWFTFTGTGGDITVETSASFDHRQAIASGSCGSLANIVCDDGSVGTETHTFASVLNETYYVYVAHYSSGNTTTGTIDITLTCAVVPTCTPAEIGSQTIMPDCANSQFSVDVEILAEGDAGTVIDDGTTTYPITGTGIITVGPYADGTSVTLDIVHVDSDCDFELGTYDYTCPQPGDLCSSAVVLTPGTPQVGATTTGAGSFSDSNTAPEVNPCSGNYNDLEYWFEYTAVATGESLDITVSDLTSNWYGVFVIDNCPDSAPTCLAQDTNGSTMDDLTLTTPTLTAGTTYYIVITDYIEGPTSFTINSTVIPPLACTPGEATPTIVPDCGNSQFSIDVDVTLQGNATSIFDGTTSYPVTGTGVVTVGPYADGSSITLEIVHDDSACDFDLGTYDYTCPPSNIDCANATPIACGQTINASSVGSTGTSEDVGCSMGDNGIWFTFTGTGGDITVETSASFDHRQAIASGACGSLVNIVCDDGSVGTETHTFASVLNETYYVYVAYYSSGSTITGTVDITLTCAVVPTCTPAEIGSQTIMPDCANSQFSVDVEILAEGDAGTVIDDGTTTYPITGTGIITVGPYADGTSVTLDIVHVDSDCDFSLGDFAYTCPPDNDEPAGGIKLQNGDTMCDDPVVGTNVGATTSVDGGSTASCGFTDPGNDVWFMIQIPSTGEITVETSSSGLGDALTDTLMTIYSGTPGSLVEIACSDDEGSGFFSSITLTGYTPGDEYYVRVWDYQNNDFGSFNICAWSPSTLGVESNVFETFSYYPNPVSSVLSLKAQDNISNVTVHNMLGQEVLRATPNTVNSELDMSGLQTGAYFVKVTIGDSTNTIRVLKN